MGDEDRDQERERRRRWGLEQLERDARADGLEPLTDDGPVVSPEPVLTHRDEPAVIAPALPADTRPDRIVCQVCLRTVRRRQRRALSPGVTVCAACFGQPEQLPGQRERWLALPREARRALLALHHRIDPATGRRVRLPPLERTDYLESDDGLAVEQGTTVSAGMVDLREPPNYWTLRRSRPMAVS